MRKFLIPTLLFAVLPLCGWHALPGDLNLSPGEWSLASGARLSSITIKEYVLSTTPGGIEYMVSRLDWNLSLVPTIGADFSCQLNPSFVLSFGANIGKYAKKGTMDDYDWAKEDGSGHLLYNGVWSHYSHHENKLRHLITADVNLFYQSGQKTRLYLGGGFLFKVVSMDGVNGYYWHTDPTDPITTPGPTCEFVGTISGHAISYAHYSFIPYFGAGLRREFGPRFFANGFLLATPLTWAIGKDTHWTSYPAYDAKYTDYLEWDLYLFFSLKIGFALSRRTTLSLGWEMVYQPRAEGNTKVEPWGGGSVVYADTGGGSFMSHSLLLRCSLRL